MRYFIFISFLIGFCLSLVGQDTVHLDLPTQNVEQGENIAVDVVVAGFENVVGAQFTMKYDKEVINYLDVDNFGIASINKNNNFGIPADENGVITAVQMGVATITVSALVSDTLLSAVNSIQVIPLLMEPPPPIQGL